MTLWHKASLVTSLKHITLAPNLSRRHAAAQSLYVKTSRQEANSPFKLIILSGLRSFCPHSPVERFLEIQWRALTLKFASNNKCNTFFKKQNLDHNNPTSFVGMLFLMGLRCPWSCLLRQTSVQGSLLPSTKVQILPQFITKNLHMWHKLQHQSSHY